MVYQGKGGGLIQDLQSEGRFLQLLLMIYKSYMTCLSLNYRSYGIFLIMGNAGFRSSAALPGSSSRRWKLRNLWEPCCPTRGEVWELRGIVESYMCMENSSRCVYRYIPYVYIYIY